MRRLIRIASALALAGMLIEASACKHRKRQSVSAEVDDGTLRSMVQVTDPRAAVQLTKGFYDVEQNAWRWTMGQFSVALRPPAHAAEKGALLVVRMTVPPIVIETLKQVKLSASINGVALPPQTYDKSGPQSYSRDVPASVLSGDAVSVDFVLDRFMPAHGADQRELGVIVSAVGFEAK